MKLPGIPDPREFAIKALAVVGVIAALVATGVYLGYGWGAGKWEAKYNGLVAANEKLKSEQAAKVAAASHAALTRLKEAEGERNEAYATIARLRAQRPRNDGVTCQPAAETATAGAPAVVVFSRGAVGMLNASLSGNAALADPEGAADPARQAEDSGFAWSDITGVVAENAKSCSADRERFQRLLDVLVSSGAVVEE